MRVALVLAGDLDAESGGFYYDRRLCERLRERGHAVEVVSVPRGSYRRQLSVNLRSRRLGGRLEPFDVVVEDGLAHPALLAVNRRLSTPTVALVHMIAGRARARTKGACATLAQRGVRVVERQFLAGVDAAVYNAETTRRDAVALGGPDRSAVASPAGDRFDPNPSESAIRDRAGDGPLAVTFLGNVVPRKGLDTLVAGLARIDGAAVDWELTVVGDRTADPAHVAAVEAAVAAAGLDDRVRFTGHLEDAAVAARLRETHVLAVPSRYEPFGMVYLEAMGFGCVPVATTAGGAGEVVRDGESGFLVGPGDAAAVAAAVRRLTDRDRLARMGIAARRAYEAWPSWSETLDRAVDFLEAEAGVDSRTTPPTEALGATGGRAP